eukprot:4990048-Prymnesium_polylepis.1
MRVLLLIEKLAEDQTLHGANHLILVDRTWNPAVDQQSLGRIHRPGGRRSCPADGWCPEPCPTIKCAGVVFGRYSF